MKNYIFGLLADDDNTSVISLEIEKDLAELSSNEIYEMVISIAKKHVEWNSVATGYSPAVLFETKYILFIRNNSLHKYTIQEIESDLDLTKIYYDKIHVEDGYLYGIIISESCPYILKMNTTNLRFLVHDDSFNVVLKFLSLCDFDLKIFYNDEAPLIFFDPTSLEYVKIQCTSEHDMIFDKGF